MAYERAEMSELDAVLAKHDKMRLIASQPWQIISGIFLALCLGACVAEWGEPLSEEDWGEPIADAMSNFAVETEKQSDAQDPDEQQEYAYCGRSGPNLQNQVITNASYPNAARQRSGSGTNCVALGSLQPTDDAHYYCYTSGLDGYTWTYLRNMRTGVRGWTRDDLLKNYGSNRYCGF